MTPRDRTVLGTTLAFVLVVSSMLLTGADDGGRTAPGTEPLLVAGDVMPPRLLEKVPPEYPPEARAAGIEGKVVLEAVIGKDGTVRDIKVLRSIPQLDGAALRALRQWRYDPATLHGEPVDVFFTVIIEFGLDGAPEIAELAELENASRTIMLDFDDALLGDVLDAVTQKTGLTILRGLTLDDTRRITVKYGDLQTKRALERLAQDASLVYVVLDSHTLSVGPKAEKR